MRRHIPKKVRFGFLAATAITIATGLPVAQTKAANTVPVAGTKDKVSSRIGFFERGSTYTPDTGGHTGKAGDYAIDFGAKGSGPVDIKDGSFLNAATSKDELSFAVWIKKYDIAASSAFWAVSPASNNGARGYQAHVPWSDDTIYFDTAGCCDGTQRINANISSFANYSGDDTWWNDWHFFVFSKKADDKQIWIDGVLFLEGNTDSGNAAAPLPTDFNELFLGSDNTGTGNLIHGIVDDFAVFSTQLSEADINALFTGTAPTALPAADGLMAFWDFNDPPAGGNFTTVVPTPDSITAGPDFVKIVNVNSTTPWSQANVSLKVDGNPVTGTLSLDGSTATLIYIPSPIFAEGSTHTVSLTYPGGSQTSLEWSFTVGIYTKDSVGSHAGTLAGPLYSENSGGHTGKPGDYAIDFGSAGSGAVSVINAAFLNTATANDELSFGLWVKKYDINAGSAFWAISPASGTDQRGFQAHIPWSDDTIYFDTAGCCGSDTRINANISTFPNYSGDDTWWNDWHYFVFSKKADDKQVWIDGVLFLEGNTDTGNIAAPLLTDFTQLMIGSGPAGDTGFHGLIDDFTVFSTQLGEADINSLFTGTAPSALPTADGLLAYWDFNDLSPGGTFISFAPTAGSTNALPNSVQIVHQQGTKLWDLSKVSLKIDGTPVTAQTTREGAEGGRVTVSYIPSPIFAIGSSHTASLTYPDPSGALVTKDWQFTVGYYVKDVLHQYVGALTGAAALTADAGGHSGKPGDLALDLGKTQTGQSMRIPDASFLNAIAANDQMAVAGWQKLWSVHAAAFFWGTSPSSNGGQRGWGSFPWDNNNIYFDTDGCCDGALQRINADITTFGGYSGDASWWQDWHYFVYQKNLSTKEIWIDGQLFTSGDNSNPLPTDFTQAYVGSDVADNVQLQGLIDDFAVFGTSLDEATIGQLASGTLPTALPASDKLVAYWDFNSAPVGPPQSTITVATAAGKITITFTGTLYSSDKVKGGTWAPVTGAISPMVVTPSDAQRFYQAGQ